MDLQRLRVESNEKRWNVLNLRNLISGGKVSGSALVSTDGTRATFVCNCGNEFSRKLSNKATSSTVQCLSCSNSRPFVGERHVFKRIKSDAVRAGRDFNITLDFFIEMSHRPCFYCNRSNINSVNVPSKKGGYLIKGFRYNGLDRIDNAIGYEEDNCVPCCVVCNRAKNSMSFDEFMDYIQALVGHQNSIGETHDEYGRKVHSKRIHDRRRQSKAGKYSGSEELQEDNLPVSNVGPVGEVHDSWTTDEWSRGFVGGAYRNVERTAQT